MKTYIRTIATHGVVASLGFVAGIYVLPILTAPPGPSVQEVQVTAANATFTGVFRRDAKGSDPFHWGEGTVSVSPDAIALQGKLPPGPDYKLYLSPQPVESKADFIRLRSQMVQVGPIKTFDNFVVPVPATVDIKKYSNVIVWCEAFSVLIAATGYK